ncbi:MAG: hypothetical protein R3F53_11925 [Gammaproteobacteria bacterium]
MANEQGLSILSFDGARLAFPLSEAVSIRRSTELDETHKIPLAVGSVIHADRLWPVFGLNANYQPLASLTAGTIYCVCLSADNGQTGVALACETVNTISLTDDVMPPEPLPTCMQRAATPLQQLFRQGEQLVPISTAPALAAYLRSLVLTE